MNLLSNFIFISLVAVSIYYAVKSFGRIRKNILLGKPHKATDRVPERIKNMVLTALGQKKMFDRPIPAILHLFIYIGFLVVNLEMLEILIDGSFGTHRIFSTYLGGLYPVMISIFELFAVAVIISCVAFFIRRNIIKLARFQSPELQNFPRQDANTILYVEVVLMLAFINMNIADQTLQRMGILESAPMGNFLISSQFVDLYLSLSSSTLLLLERASWWTHITGVLLFINYVPYSKHLHIMLAFPNTFYANLTSKGQMENMPAVTKEVKLMLNIPIDEAETAPLTTEVLRFGAKDVQDLTWKNLLDAYTCTECGRCTSECPANLTGKKLSPRKIMMDTRDRLAEVGMNLEKNVADEKSLLGDYILEEELLACTSCNACVEACPVNINPLEIIVQLKRYKVMEESKAPASWNSMFSNIETNFAPWKFSPSDRFNWSEKV